jgi:hypothetical protein
MAYAKELVGGAISPVTAGVMGGAYGAVAAAGSVSTDATLVGSSMAIVTAADGTKGVILYAGQIGDEVTIFNNSGSTLKVYPDSGSAISVGGTGLGTADAAFSHLTYKTVTYKKVTSTQWLSRVGA